MRGSSGSLLGARRQTEPERRDRTRTRVAIRQGSDAPDGSGRSPARPAKAASPRGRASRTGAGAMLRARSAQDRRPARRRPGRDRPGPAPAPAPERRSRPRAGPAAARQASTQAATRSRQTTQPASRSAACAASAQREQAEDQPQERDASPARAASSISAATTGTAIPSRSPGRNAAATSAAASASPSSGSSTIIRHPFGVRSSVRIVPSWSSTIQRAIASPSPLPPSPLDRAWSER